MKKYLYKIECSSGASLYIGCYCDTPNKNYRIYYNGSDTGLRYEYIENAARHIKRIADIWNDKKILKECYYKTAENIPCHGSNAI